VVHVALVVIARRLPSPRALEDGLAGPRIRGQLGELAIGLEQRLHATLPGEPQALAAVLRGVASQVTKAVIAGARLGAVGALVDHEAGARELDGDVEHGALAIPGALVALERDAILGANLDGAHVASGELLRQGAGAELPDLVLDA